MSECRSADSADINDKIIRFSAVPNVQDFGQQSEPESITQGECRSADFANFNDKYTTFTAVQMLNILGKSWKPQASLSETESRRLALSIEDLISVIYQVGNSLVGRAI